MKTRRYFHTFSSLLCAAISILFTGRSASAQYTDWQHSGSMHILTTPDGANLPASESVTDFPLLVRLDKDFFDFTQARSNGEDIRFSTPAGAALSHQIEQWDADKGSAIIWVRIPKITGSSTQEIKMHWGHASTPCASDGKAVFNPSNGHLAVWHMNGPVTEDEVGAIKSKDAGTTAAPGMIGEARHFPGDRGVYCGEDITTFPVGSAPHSSSAWFRGDKQNCRVLSWGKEYRQGKIQMWYSSPSKIRMDCYFSDADVRSSPSIPLDQWTHVVHTYQKGESRIYINGVLDAEARTRAETLSIERPARMWIGGWYNNFDFIGDIDEVRISGVTRSPAWIKLEYENQKTLHTLVGPLVKPGDTLSLSPGELTVSEGQSAKVAAKTAGAQKLYWILKRGAQETVVGVDRRSYTFNAGRVSGDDSVVLRLKAVYSHGARTQDVSIKIKDVIPDPVVRLKAPKQWDGRRTIEIVPQIANVQAMQAAGAGDLTYNWDVSGMAVLKEIAPGKLILTRAQNSGKMTVTLSLSNGGHVVTASTNVTVEEPDTDAWVSRIPGDTDMPVEGQFYARDSSGVGTLVCRGTLKDRAEATFLRVFMGGAKYAEQSQTPGKDGAYGFSVKLAPALVIYRIEFGTRTEGLEKVLHRAGDIVCGDAYIIEGQSNALATDTGEESPRVTNEWVRSYGQARFFKEGERENLWCKPVWKAHNKEQKEYWAELGWWGMELANRLVASQQVPIFMLNAARGGTRIDQHQRNDENPADLDTIYGRMLWRVQQAHLTHGIRAIIWHQGENDQGAAGPDGDYGWKTYERYFVEMSADWKRDLPNVTRYYMFQIWPNACSMGAGNGDMLREILRSLPSLYSNMDILSTLGIQPGGSCHYPLEGWSIFAERIQRLLERDFYGSQVNRPITAPNLVQACYVDTTRRSIALAFDQPVVWVDQLANQFYLDDTEGVVVGGMIKGNVLTLTVKESGAFERITYLKEMAWNQNNLLFGKNGMAALTFCDVPIQSSHSSIPNAPRP
ncbi:MAG: DUF2341 domain-containing protein [Planctomycetes bacterium]|nr:DUF2341 domain-containing protein [Planctomycetota bacterium]